MKTQEIKDIQALINIFFPFAEELLIKYGKFLPYAGATTLAGDFVSVGGPHDSKEPADSKTIITDLKLSLQLGNTKYLVVAIFYEARTIDDQTGKTDDAIAVFVEHKDGQSAYEFFYPYKLEGKENFIIDDSYGITVSNEIFLMRSG